MRAEQAALTASSSVTPASTAATEARAPTNAKQHRTTYQYGNYEAYYGYRYANLGPRRGADPVGLDPRLGALDPSWFRGGTCLDIGCNAGHLTIAIAQTFEVASMLGVDIDAALVTKACEHLRAHERAAAPSAPLQQPRAPAPRPPTVAGTSLDNDDFRRLFLATAAPAAARVAAFPGNTRFEATNFVQEPPGAAQLGVEAGVGSFDVVTCFSTSKWVHLNFGDVGLTRLFRRAHACLRRGGRFVLEPQPWSSYRKRATLTPTIARHFREIVLRPPQFAEFLTSEAVGFVRAQALEVPYDARTAPGFTRRPVLVFTK